MTKHIRHGRGSVRPYLYGHYELPDFLEQVFDAKTLERHEMGERSAHVELAIGDSVVVVEAGELPADITPTIASIYVYVEDPDAAYARALEAGAKSISEPEDKHYEERSAGIQDPFGNTWWISKYLG
jgi:uncharacterized glyoxalase superfamily protein PhnB